MNYFLFLMERLFNHPNSMGMAVMLMYLAKVPLGERRIASTSTARLNTSFLFSETPPSNFLHFGPAPLYSHRKGMMKNSARRTTTTAIRIAISSMPPYYPERSGER